MVKSVTSTNSQNWTQDDYKPQAPPDNTNNIIIITVLFDFYLINFIIWFCLDFYVLNPKLWAEVWVWKYLSSPFKNP